MNYIVRWCGYDGVQLERRFQFKGDAQVEAQYLEKHFDGVEIEEVPEENADED